MGSALAEIRERSRIVVDEKEYQTGVRSIEMLRRELGENVPTAAYIRQFRPDAGLFLHPEIAFNPYDPHNIAHVARTQIAGACIARVQLRRNPRAYIVEQFVLHALAWHDIAVDGDEGYEAHASRAVTRIEEKGQQTKFYSAQWLQIRELMRHHMRRDDPALDEMPLNLLAMLNDVRDADASDLMRPPIYEPLNRIVLRTAEAVEFQLPLISQHIQMVAASISGDIYEAQFAAAERIGLLRVSEPRP
ncbi:hypothetical protein HY948_01195 [Candidatus Gottesmanbacteria bacterium]|nr:hypothetical protein [Candidatus Gottesmanbacteria bacterium]